MVYYSIGEVSKKLKVSRRTLRYYDQIGLVVPTLKEDHGKRYYSKDDMLLLEKIILLKSTSMSLNDIKKVINQVTIHQVLSIHKDHLESNIKQLQQSLKHTTTLLNLLKLEGNIQWDQLLPLLSEEEQKLKQERKKLIWEKIFSKEEQSILSERMPKMEAEQGEKWVNIIKGIEICLEEGKEPNSQEGQLIAKDILILSKETFGDNQSLIAKFWEVRKSEDTSSALNLYPVKAEVLLFIEEAILQYENSNI